MRLVDDFTSPKPNIHTIAAASGYMGQELLNPPTVEGWHVGKEWIDSGALVERINFAADQVRDTHKPGVHRIAERLASSGHALSPAELVDGCLESAGPVQVSPATRQGLLSHIQKAGAISYASAEERENFSRRVAELLQLIVSTRGYQFA